MFGVDCQNNGTIFPSFLKNTSSWQTNLMADNAAIRKVSRAQQKVDRVVREVAGRAAPGKTNSSSPVVASVTSKNQPEAPRETVVASRGITDLKQWPVHFTVYWLFLLLSCYQMKCAITM
jgi:hypothetical protein